MFRTTEETRRPEEDPRSFYWVMKNVYLLTEVPFGDCTGILTDRCHIPWVCVHTVFGDHSHHPGYYPAKVLTDLSAILVYQIIDVMKRHESHVQY